MAAPSKRRQYLGRPSSRARNYQAAFIIRVFTILAAVALVSTFLTTAIIWNKFDLPNVERQTHMVASLIAVGFTLIIELLLAIPLVYYLGLRHSHRVVGPFDRLIKTLDAIGSGDYSRRLQLRPGDTLEDIAKAINRMAEQFESRSSSRRS